MDDPNITIEEYIRLEEEKARIRGKVFNWKTAKYGKIWYDEDIHELRSVKTEFPAIAFNDEIISSNDLKTDYENDNEKVNMPSLPPPEPRVSCFDDLDFFKDFENEFPAIVYNDSQTSKSDLLTEPILSPQNIDKFNDETSFSEYNEEEQNVLYFNDLSPFNIIYPNDLKSEHDNDDNEVDIIQSLRGNEITQGSNMLSETILFYLIMNLYVPFGILFDPKRYYKDGVYIRMLRRPRHQYLRYEGLQYTNGDIVDFDARLARIYRREVHRVQVFDFGGLLDLMAKGLSARMLIKHKDAQGRETDPQQGDLRDYWIGISSAGDFFSITPSYTAIRDPILRLCHRLIVCSIAGRSQTLEKVIMTDMFYLRGMDFGSVNVPYLLARYLRLFAAGRKSGALIYGSQFVARLAEHFGLLTEERLRGLTVITPALSVIDMNELVRLQICMEIDDTWDWVAQGPKRQPNAAAGAHKAAEDALVVDDDMPQAVPPPPRTQGERIARLEEELMDRAGVAYTSYSETPGEYQRRTRRRTDGASTSTAQQDQQQPDP
ncbi:hypothetical protein Tco_0912218 [Tanacetum coccineum]